MLTPSSRGRLHLSAMKNLLLTALTAFIALTGPLAGDESHWHDAQWISCDRPLNTPELAPAEVMGAWISGEEGSQVQSFQTEIELPEEPIVRAMAWWGESPEAQSAIVVNGDTRFFENFVRRPRQKIDLAFQLKPGTNTIEVRFQEPRPMLAVTFGMKIQFANGSEKVVSSGESWTFLNGKNQAAAVSILGAYSESELPPVTAYRDTRLAPAWFRQTVLVEPGLKSAILRHCGLGYGEPFLNGKAVSERVLSPPQTDYEDFSMYETDDVTALLKEGENALSVLLASGWLHQVGGFGVTFSYGRPRLRAVLELNYEDGRQQFVTTDPTWEWKEGAIVESNIYSGEVVDYRRAHRDWTSPNTGEGWQAASPIASPSKRLLPVDFAPIRKVREIAPQSISQVGEKTWLVDFGENISGWAKIALDEPSGREVLIRYTEMAKDNRLWNVPESFWWCHGEPQRDIIICDGTPRTHEAKFSYKGFRWIEISGLSTAPDPATLRAVFVHNDCEVIADFSSSDPLLDRLWEMGVRSHLGNMHSILEDCPHREKCQWGGDLHGSWAMGFHALDSAEFYRQQVRLYYTGQMAKGGIPGLTGVGKRLANVQMDFNWGVSPLFLTWRLWNQHGDLETAREFHPQMRHYLAHFAKVDPSGFPSLHKHADHAAPESDIPRNPQDKALISAINYFAAAERFAQLCDALAKPADAAWARELAGKVRTAILTKYDPSANTFGNGTHDSLALAMGLFRDEPETAAKLANSMVGYYRANGHKFDGGFMSYWLYPMLSRYGYQDDALKMLVNTNYPGPAWSVEAWDATTFWERFYTDTTAQFERSLNHHATNHPAAWLLTDLAGIQHDESQPGGQAILLAPTIPKNLASAKGRLKFAGEKEVSSDWTQQGDTLKWTISLPEGLETTLKLTGWEQSDHTPLPNSLPPGEHTLNLVRKK